MIKKLTLLVFVIFVSLFGDKYYVRANQTDGDITGDGSSSKPWQHISFAINNTVVAKTDSIYLFGTFNLKKDAGRDSIGVDSGLNVRKSLTFIGEDPSKTIIQGDDVFVPDSIKWRIFYVTDNGTETDVKFENLTIKYGHGFPCGGIYANFSDALNSLTINNCIISDNLYSDSEPLNWDIGGAALGQVGGNLMINNSTIKNNINLNTGSLYQLRGCGGIYYQPAFDNTICLIQNTAIIDNHSNFYGGGIRIPANAFNATVNINNCTIAGNSTADETGSAIFISNAAKSVPTFGITVTINSCTIADNTSSSLGYAIYNQQTSGCDNIIVKNSIIKNSYKNARNFFPNTDIDTPVDIPPDCYTLSYSVIDDSSLVDEEGTNFTNYKDPIITGIKNENGTYFYKIVEGSPAKDAIPRGRFADYPYYNGAGVEYVTTDNDTTSIDQRGHIAWNQAKDMGAYESPYYWVDVTDKKEYETIPYWKTDLKVADEIEGWTDYMRAQTGGKIILTENSEIERFDKSELRWNAGSFLTVNANSKIINGFVSADSVSVLDDAQLTLQGTTVMIPVAASVNVGNNSKLIIDYGSRISLQNDLNVNVSENAEIILKNNGILSAYGVTFSYSDETGNWLGINCEASSSILLDSDVITNAVYGLKAVGAETNVANCTFTNCKNGISLANCIGVGLHDNDFYGYGEGTGVSLTQYYGEVIGNTISGFSHGMDLTTCSPLLTKNIIKNNVNYGLCALGWNTTPQLIDPNSTKSYLNNDIKGNGIAQIYLKYSASAYMTGGNNNVYTGVVGIIPDIPCIMGVSNTATTVKAALPLKINIDAERNYWGAKDSTQIINNFNSFFNLWTFGTFNSGYKIHYLPIATKPYTYENQLPINQLSSNLPPDPSSILLSNAIKQELSGNLKPSIKLYENVIKRDSTSAEALVASARLPLVYLESGLAEDPLIQLYDAAIASEDFTNKKFYKEMKVSTYLKNARYDEAIALAEEMKTEAETEEEALLSEIDISIANAMKNRGNKGASDTDNLNKLIAKLSRSNDKDELDSPADLTESVLPTESKLYQNYPNPFNPVTQIKFDLAKSAKVRLSVYNVSGQLVSELVSGVMNAGNHGVDFDGSKLNSGVYYYTLNTDGKNITKKMVLTK